MTYVGADFSPSFWNNGYEFNYVPGNHPSSGPSRDPKEFKKKGQGF